ncbi:hypothetical protein [Coxiella-like endosymbiont]|uniref:hypothetical protein n=1 Tax=Coxiella-like endosymbiont TaxID=1592897 RepID=UPI00272B3A92|nr:hypothetical protein [Coxiella-like endosymbiont]
MLVIIFFNLLQALPSIENVTTGPRNDQIYAGNTIITTGSGYETVYVTARSNHIRITDFTPTDTISLWLSFPQYTQCQSLDIETTTHPDQCITTLNIKGENCLIPFKFKSVSLEGFCNRPINIIDQITFFSQLLHFYYYPNDNLIVAHLLTS